MNALIKSVKKGDVIDARAIEKQYGCEKGSTAHSNALVALKRQLEKMYPNLTICIKDYGIKILNDGEASDYNFLMHLQHIHGIRYRHRKNMAVDTSKMDADQKKMHLRRMETQGKAAAWLEQELKRTVPMDITKHQTK